MSQNVRRNWRNSDAFILISKPKGMGFRPSILVRAYRECQVTGFNNPVAVASYSNYGYRLFSSARGFRKDLERNRN